MTFREFDDPEKLRTEVVRLVVEGRVEATIPGFQDPRDVPLEAKLAVLRYGTGDRRAEGDSPGTYVCDAWLEPFGVCQGRYAIRSQEDGDVLVIHSVLQVV